MSSAYKMSHTPVLLKEVIELLEPKEGEVIIDGTAGGGGHAKEILKLIGNAGKLLLVDWDKKAIDNLKKEMKDYKNILLTEGNYADLPEIMRENNFPKADGLLVDLGFSSGQLENSGRGFSFLKDEPLLMTYSDQSEPLCDFLKRSKLPDLIEIIRKFGEERYAKKIAEAIFAKRKEIETSKQLADIIREAVPKSYEHGHRLGGASRIHPATRTFQAFRIYLNQELDNLEKILDSLAEILNPGGRVAVISFHSLEDRIVKVNFKESEKKGRLKILTEKPIIAAAQEVAVNPRARSAKLRAAMII